MFSTEASEFNNDTAFLDNISLWGVFKAVLTVILIYSMFFYILRLSTAKQEDQRIQEVGMAITALAAEGYSIYIDGEKELFVPSLENYAVEFDKTARQINLTSAARDSRTYLQELFEFRGGLLHFGG